VYARGAVLLLCSARGAVLLLCSARGAVLSLYSVVVIVAVGACAVLPDGCARGAVYIACQIPVPSCSVCWVPRVPQIFVTSKPLSVLTMAFCVPFVRSDPVVAIFVLLPSLLITIIGTLLLCRPYVSDVQQSAP
jgi:hypothetical protein